VLSECFVRNACDATKFIKTKFALNFTKFIFNLAYISQQALSNAKIYDQYTGSVLNPGQNP